MKKIYFFFLLLILTTLSSKYTSELKANPSDLGCTSEISENYLINYNNLKINKIEIETLNYRNWTVNSIKIITSSTRYVDDIYKKDLKQK